MSSRTNHSNEIAMMRRAANTLPDAFLANSILVASDLLELHDATGLSLDNWNVARVFVEDQMKFAKDLLNESQNARTTVEPNGV